MNRWLPAAMARRTSIDWHFARRRLRARRYLAREGMEDLRSEGGPIHYGFVAKAACSFLGCTSRSLEKSRTSKRSLLAEEFVLASG